MEKANENQLNLHHLGQMKDVVVQSSHSFCHAVMHIKRVYFLEALG